MYDTQKQSQSMRITDCEYAVRLHFSIFIYLAHYMYDRTATHIRCHLPPSVVSSYRYSANLLPAVEEDKQPDAITASAGIRSSVLNSAASTDEIESIIKGELQQARAMLGVNDGTFMGSFNMEVEKAIGSLGLGQQQALSTVHEKASLALLREYQPIGLIITSDEPSHSGFAKRSLLLWLLGYY